MLCIVFSKKRMIAGAKLNQAELIPIDGDKFISLRNQPFAKVLQQHLVDITNNYTEMRKKMGLQSQTKVPTAISLPVDADVNGKTDYQHEIVNIFKSPQARNNQLIHIDYTPLSFFYGLEGHLKISEEPCIVLEGMDDYVNICYYNIDEQKEKEVLKELDLIKGTPFQNENYMRNGIFNFVPIKNLGSAAGLLNLLKESELEFVKNGLKIDEQDKQEIRKQIYKPTRVKNITLQKTSGTVSILAELRISSQRYDDSLSINKSSLATRINHAKLEQLGIKHVLLLGDFLKNEALKDYFNKELRIGSKVFQLDSKVEEAEYHVIVNGLTSKTNEILKAKAEEERRRREEEERRRREEEERRRREAERKAQIARDNLLQEIRVQCTDPNNRSEYEQKYINQGIRLGIPKEVLTWNIQEAIKSATLDIPEKPIYAQNKAAEVNDYVDSQATSNSNDAGNLAEKMVVQNDAPPFYTSNSNQAGGVKNTDKKQPSVSAKRSFINAATSNKNDLSSKGVNDKDLPSLRQDPISRPVGERSVSEQIMNRLTSEVQKKQIKNGPESLKEASLNARQAVKENKKTEGSGKTSEIGKSDANSASDTSTTPAGSNNTNGKDVVKKNNEDTNNSPEVIANTKAVATKGDIEDKLKKSSKKDQLELNDANSSLEEIFEIEGVLLDPEFITKKATHIITHDTKVVKILPRTELNKPERIAAFENLFKKELTYYQELSEIFEAKEGKYYFRTYIERNTLKDYVKKIGLDKKDHFDKLTSNDLKLILEVWREIKGLNVSHANLSEYNILVISKRKWNLQRETEIRLIGFTSVDCTVKEMEEQVHKIWAKLIGADIYLDFRKKFKI